MGKKGSHGSGTVYKKGNKYQGAYYKPDGRRGYVSAKTKTECRQKLRQAMTDADRGISFDTTTKLGEYLDNWLPRIKGKGIRQRTWERYEQLVRVHIKPALGHIKLKDLKRPHVEKLYSDKLEQVSPRTVQYIHTTLHKVLKDAKSDGVIHNNVADNLKPSNPRRHEITPLTPEQVNSFFAAAKGNRYEALYIVAIHYGLRQGELLGLKWQDVDLDKGTMQVRRTMSESRAGRIEEDTKSGKGRVIKLSESVVKALREHREQQEQEKSAATKYEDLELIFASVKGTPVNSSNLTYRSFKPILKSAGLVTKDGKPLIRFHDLRHSCATIRIVTGKQNIQQVQKLLGHSSAAITLDIYTHSQDDEEDVMESILR